MSLRLTYRPLSGWPGETDHGQPVSIFRASWGNTAALLRREADAIGAVDIVVEQDVPESAIRQDGEVRRNASVRSPRAAVRLIGTRHGDLVYRCQRYRHWGCNIRAIALALEALRKVDRYGVGSAGEQYAGWAALPSADPVDVLADAAGLPPATVRADPREAYRVAARRTHPDHGGTAERFDAVAKAYEQIGST